jgi:hypothetical protein
MDAGIWIASTVVARSSGELLLPDVGIAAAAVEAVQR